jgi:hypothetical protein
MKKIRIALAAMAVAGLLAACGSSADDGGDADDGVASLDGGSTTTSPDGEEQTTETSVDPQEAMLAYTECMREEGIDMPDPQFSEDGEGGMVITREADSGEDQGPMFDPESEEFQAAQDKCGSIMDEAIGSIEIDPEQQAEMREQMLEYAQCMRDQGIDFPDPEFSDNGRVTMGMGGGEGAEPPSDAEMEAMDAANEVCAQEGGPIAMGAAPAGGQDD